MRRSERRILKVGAFVALACLALYFYNQRPHVSPSEGNHPWGEPNRPQIDPEPYRANTQPPVVGEANVVAVEPNHGGGHVDPNVGHGKRSVGEIKPGASALRKHGIVGLLPDGTAAWKPQPIIGRQENVHAELAKNGFNGRLSDSLSLDRNATDNRHPLCHKQVFDTAALPTTSVVFVFHNEWFSTLLRSVHSVLNRSPPELLHEIILVDDSSVKPWLGKQLDDYVALLPKVKLVRLPVRSGLVKARLKGFEVATGDTVTVLDSHTEVQPGWLEPLMWKIKESRTSLVMPIIDSLNAETFEFLPYGIGCTLGFIWNLIEHGMDIQEHARAARTSEIDPIPSPTHAGGLFAVDRHYFQEIGGYDTEFGFWGTENLELSFRLWLCGGKIECMPCSRVYHVFRSGGVPYSSPAGHVTKNKLRTAAIWMDEFGAVVKDTLWVGNTEIGPLDHMLDLKKRLNCKPFSWFLQNVFPESIITKWEDIVCLGHITSRATRSCIDAVQGSHSGSRVGMHGCHDHGNGQKFLCVLAGFVRPMSNVEMCLAHDMTFKWCEPTKPDTLWDFTTTGQLKQRNGNKCLVTGADGKMEMEQCSDSPLQQWDLQLPPRNPNPITHP